ncbi:hypothetical protein ACSBR2_008168 [Camellia fascicularis]
MEVYPLAVKAEASPVSQNESTDENLEFGPTNSQITKVVFENEKGEYKVRLVKQILWVNGMSYELQEIYEIGNSVNSNFNGNDSSKECVVCLSEPRDTTVLPCRHMSKVDLIGILLLHHILLSLRELLSLLYHDGFGITM